MIGSYKDKAVKGDYIGFTFNGVHSSDLGIMRVSNGSRYSSNLLPALSDIKGQVQNGIDGTAYFGSTYTQTPINLEVAFDRVTEVELNKMKRLFGDKNPHYLWFDETPYKEILVKIAQPPQFNFIAFDETHNGGPARVYKGDAKINFISYTPYTRSRVAFLDSPVDQVYFKYAYGEPNYYKIQTANKRGVGKLNLFKIYATFDSNREQILSIDREIPMLPTSMGNAYSDNFNQIVKWAGTHTAIFELKNGTRQTISLLQNYNKEDFESLAFDSSNIFIEENEGGICYGFFCSKELTLETFYNYEEWAESSNLRKKHEDGIIYDTFDSGEAYLYNAGDVDSPLSLTWIGLEYPGDTLELYTLKDFERKNGGEKVVPLQSLTISPFKLKKGVNGFIIDSKLKNLKDIDDEQLITGKVSSNFHISGDFLKIPATYDKETFVLVSNNSQSYIIEHPHLYY